MLLVVDHDFLFYNVDEELGSLPRVAISKARMGPLFVHQLVMADEVSENVLIHQLVDLTTLKIADLILNACIIVQRILLICQFDTLVFDSV